MRGTSPKPVRVAAVLVGLQGAAGAIAAAVFLIRGVSGADRRIVDGFGNAAWFAVIGGALLAAGWALWTGRRWGRGIAVYAQLLLLGVSWYAGVGSHRWAYAVAVALIAIAVVGLLFSPAALRWLTDERR